MIISLCIAISFLICAIIWQFPIYKESRRHSFFFLIGYIIITIIPTICYNIRDKNNNESIIHFIKKIIIPMIVAAVLIAQLVSVINIMTNNKDIVDNLNINPKISDTDKNRFSLFTWVALILLILQMWGYTKILTMNLQNNLKSGQGSLLEKLENSKVLGKFMYRRGGKGGLIWQAIRGCILLIGAGISSWMIFEIYQFLEVFCTDDCRL